MNRYQFWSLISLSGLLVVLLFLQILLIRQTNYEQTRLVMAQQVINQGQAFQTNLKQLAMRIVQLSQQTQDQGLKDLLTRQQISFTPTTDAGGNGAAPAPATH
jgi:hypothetical protein